MSDGIACIVVGELRQHRFASDGPSPPEPLLDPDTLDRVTVRCTSDIHAAAEALHELASERGLRVAVTPDISSKDAMLDEDGTIINGEIFGWIEDGERWWEDTRLALSSPLPRACRYESEVFWVNEDGFHGRWANTYLDDMDLRDFRKRSLVSAAIVVPVHQPFGQIGAVSYTPVDRDQTDLSDAYARHGDLLAMASRRFVAGYTTAMRRTNRLIPSDCTLSKREVECLRWAALGKTDKEISMILERSHATVRYHVHRAGEKLNAVNRSQTIFKAGQLGYLGASD